MSGTSSGRKNNYSHTTNVTILSNEANKIDSYLPKIFFIVKLSKVPSAAPNDVTKETEANLQILTLWYHFFASIPEAV